jgi:hypothetical protein
VAARLIEGGLPTEATVEHVLVAKYADHSPLYRQAQIYERQGLGLDRSTLADWVGRAAFHLRPVRERILAHLKSSTKLFADETTARRSMLGTIDPWADRTRRRSPMSTRPTARRRTEAYRADWRNKYLKADACVANPGR